MTGRPGVAAFDFDGTLARQDTLVPFLRQACGTRRVVAATARAALAARSRDTLKVAAVGHLFRGRTADELDELGRAYVPTLIVGAAPRAARPAALAPGRGPRGRHRVGVARAPTCGRSPTQLDLDDALAVELVVGADGVLTGAVVGEANTPGAREGGPAAPPGRRSGSASTRRSSCGPTATRRATRSCWRAPTTRPGWAGGPLGPCDRRSGGQAKPLRTAADGRRLTAIAVGTPPMAARPRVTRADRAQGAGPVVRAVGR